MSFLADFDKSRKGPIPFRDSRSEQPNFRIDMISSFRSSRSRTEKFKSNYSPTLSRTSRTE
ncbi:hypothetical protein OUZ56_027209 [Daphnia magna]|uniref:Uncharacterized protein n=1 Tax=Daphnia magna TaxID=35525 RepID=A0ABQ9ZP40_9CRUS|nr:hypothetical protein OUZ56_027209 [Daphnia magna]